MTVVLKVETAKKVDLKVEPAHLKHEKAWSLDFESAKTVVLKAEHAHPLVMGSISKQCFKKLNHLPGIIGVARVFATRD